MTNYRLDDNLGYSIKDQLNSYLFSFEGHREVLTTLNITFGGLLAGGVAQCIHSAILIHGTRKVFLYKSNTIFFCLCVQRQILLSAEPIGPLRFRTILGEGASVRQPHKRNHKKKKYPHLKKSVFSLLYCP